MKRFNPQKDGKLEEKTFISNITACILSIILCLSCLCATTWSWFTDSVSSGVNIIQSSNLSLCITDANGKVVQPNENGVYELEAGTYTISVTTPGDKATNYYEVLLEYDKSLHATLIIYDDGEADTIIFPKNAKLTPTPHWGA